MISTYSKMCADYHLTDIQGYEGVNLTILLLANKIKQERIEAAKYRSPELIEAAQHRIERMMFALSYINEISNDIQKYLEVKYDSGGTESGS